MREKFNRWSDRTNTEQDVRNAKLEKLRKAIITRTQDNLSSLKPN